MKTDNKRIVYLFFIFIVLASSSYAQVNVSGYVLDGADESIVIGGATVKLYNTTTSAHILLDTNITAADGYYQVNGTCGGSQTFPGNYTLSYDAASYESTNYSFLVTGTRRNPGCPYQKQNFNKTLVPLAIPHGQVDGYVKINLSPYDPITNDAVVYVKLGGSIIDVVSTNAAGYYAVNLSPENYTFEYAKVNFFSKTIENISVTDASSQTFNVYLTPKAYLEGRVIVGNTGIAGVLVRVGGTTAITDQVGLYSLSAPPGEYNVTISQSGYVTKTFEVNLTEGTVTFKNFSMNPVRVEAAAGPEGRGTPYIEENETYEELPEIQIPEPMVEPKPGIILNVITPTKKISVDTFDFDIPVEIENTGNVELQGLKLQVITPSGWKSHEVTVPQLGVGQKQRVSMPVTSIFCSDKLTSDINYIEDKYKFTIKALHQEINMEKDVAVELDMPNIKPITCPAKVRNNLVESLIVINNKGNAMQEKVELEFDISDQKSQLILDYFKLPEVPADKVLVLRKVYIVLDVPETKKYQMNVKMYKGGNLFSPDYFAGSGQSEVRLEKNLINNVAGELVARFSWLRGE